MLEVFGKAIISFVEKELVEAAPDIEKAILDAVDSLVGMLSEFIGAKAAALSAPEDKEQE